MKHAKDTPIAFSGLSAIGQLELDENFKKRVLSHEGDAPLHQFQRRHNIWLQPKADTRTNREVMTTLLASQGENCNDCIEKLLAIEISFRDLGSLKEKDLELMGFKNHEQQKMLMDLFKMLPNQELSYESICKLPEAESYNSQIVTSSGSQLQTMRAALAAANYKLKIMPPHDVIVGEKSFASRFVLEALTELRGATDEITKELEELEKIISGKEISKSGNKLSFSAGSWILCTSVITGALAAFWIWKLNKQG